MVNPRRRQVATKALAAASTVRRNNLRRFVGPFKRFATLADMAASLHVSASRLTQLIGIRPIRRVTEVTARKFEYLLGLPAGTLDQE